MKLHSQLTGQGEPVVLIHGLFGSYENLGIIARALAEQWQVVNIDVRNHGRSPHSSLMDYSSMADDLAETLDELGLEQVNLLGHSMGGKISMQFALRQPERIRKLILADIAPVTYQPRHSQIFSGLTSLNLNTLTSRAEADKHLAGYISEAGVRQFLLKSLTKENDTFQWRFNLDALQQNYTSILDTPPAEGQFTGPVLFIKGADSDYILPEHRTAITTRFPTAQAKVIQGTGHWLHAEKPAAFTKIVKDFLLS